MQPVPALGIRRVDEVIREHVETTLAENQGLPLLVLAVSLGIHPTTLNRWLKEWNGHEEMVRDRR